MNRNKLLILPLSMLLALFSLSTVAADNEWPEITEDGLHRVHDSKLAIVYAEPGADLGPYKRVIMMEPTVAFKKNWARDQRSRSASRLSASSTVNTSKIKKDLAKEFEAVFTETLNSGGYEVVEEADEDVLLIRGSIVNLDIAAPDSHAGGRSTSLVHSAGEMTLYIELFDSVSGDLLVRALDRKSDRLNHEMYTWADSHTNKVASEKILQGWADVLLDTLNEAKKHGAPLVSESE